MREFGTKPYIHWLAGGLNVCMNEWMAWKIIPSIQTQKCDGVMELLAADDGALDDDDDLAGC